ncbi:endogenous retrovirus group 3 member 1 Env polyprotein [Marmota monax]|uniref:Envelope protein syncytin-Mar1 n=1 Tax=Marmota monax TaxID=9995 RepID=A0A059UAF5_MARMO|nr:endogenous retrovirus group 3 member 1 Env polyprotein [Marmota monax]AHZ59676.1 envelope protein syncytin-Mar1 [Marmota monax]KAF7479552.1 hypothetical protein GHT09_009220 [Marmota monax]KAF7479553.1 hypothetical protein GHT09_009220 [Marmota monax]VTJ65753.1 Hypothetical predicted protein [Marmota monax]
MLVYHLVWFPLIILGSSTPLLPQEWKSCEPCVKSIYYNEGVIQTIYLGSAPPERCYKRMTVCLWERKRVYMAWIESQYKGDIICPGNFPPTNGIWYCWPLDPQPLTWENFIKSDSSSIALRPTVSPSPAAKLYGGLSPNLNLPSLGKNLFLDLAERIAKSLGVKNCWVCGGALMSEEWPWTGTSLDAYSLLLWNKTHVELKIERPQGWVLTSEVLGKECIGRFGPHHTQWVGETPCNRILFWNSTWWPKKPTWFWADKPHWLGIRGLICKKPLKKRVLFNCTSSDTNQISSFRSIPEIHKFWSNPASSNWKAPDGLFWICGKKAYTHLPTNWRGTCTIGTIKPGFFLLPNTTGKDLGIPLYEDLGPRKKRSIGKGLDLGGQQTWAEDDWPPQRIIATYGPATWAQDGSWGYRTPIYMLNRIIRLQAVLEIITNQTATAFDLLATQQTQMRAAIYQNRLALDYLLAEEGGVCGKFNSSDCCIQIDDNGQAVKDIASNIRKLAHVPVQTWKGFKAWDPSSLFGGWFSTLGGFKSLIGIVGLLLLTCLLLPCLAPLCIKTIGSTMEAAIERRTTNKILALYKTLRQEGDNDAL